MNEKKELTNARVFSEFGFEPKALAVSVRRALTRRQPRGLEVLIGGCAFRPAKEAGNNRESFGTPRQNAARADRKKL